MNLRPYTPADFPALYAIEEICFQPPQRFSRSYMRQILSSSTSAAWIAEAEGRMAGFAIVDWSREPGPSIKTDQTLAYIQTIEVLPDFRGRGLGRELLDRLEQSAIAAGAIIIWLHVDEENHAALHLYQDSGYLCRGRQENYYGRNRAALIFAKPLEVAA